MKKARENNNAHSTVLLFEQQALLSVAVEVGTIPLILLVMFTNTACSVHFNLLLHYLVAVAYVLPKVYAHPSLLLLPHCIHSHCLKVFWTVH